MSNSKRVAFFDELRGFTVLSMVAFHACYDLVYIFGINVSLFSDLNFQEAWRCSISWTFLLLAGWMTQFSRNNVRRGLLYALCAFMAWAATSIARVDTPVSFGILYCMAACTLLYAAISPVLKRVNPYVFALIMVIVFLLTYRIPKATYSIEGLAWLGFPSPQFSSGDYYPLIPFFFIYVAGATVSGIVKTKGITYPTWMVANRLPFLSTIGRHSLLIYLLHQPIVLALLTLLFG